MLSLTFSATCADHKSKWKWLHNWYIIQNICKWILPLQLQIQRKLVFKLSSALILVHLKLHMKVIFFFHEDTIFTYNCCFEVYSYSHWTVVSILNIRVSKIWKNSLCLCQILPCFCWPPYHFISQKTLGPLFGLPIQKYHFKEKVNKNFKTAIAEH